MYQINIWISKDTHEKQSNKQFNTDTDKWLPPELQEAFIFETLNN